MFPPMAGCDLLPVAGFESVINRRGRRRLPALMETRVFPAQKFIQVADNAVQRATGQSAGHRGRAEQVVAQHQHDEQSRSWSAGSFCSDVVHLPLLVTSLRLFLRVH